MTWWQWIVLGVIVFSSIVLLCNRKIMNPSLIKDQLKIYYKFSENEKQNKINWFDIFSFLCLPLAISCCIVWGFGYQLGIESANTILTVTSILFSVLFTVLSIVTSKTKSTDAIEKKVIKETFSTITAVTVWLIISILITIVYVLLLPMLECEILFKVLTNFVFAILVHSLALLLMTIKRFYLVYSKEEDENGK
ncbi:MAG: hypothetical protein PUE65_01825 [Mollicutes bacterium]|nr:hypothetical protein [Mollicutes bacterium]